MAVDREIFVNMPVADLEKSMGFFRALGFEFNLQFTDENAACLIIGKKSYAMLLSRPLFEEFIPGKAIPDTSAAAEMLVAVSAPDREAVDTMIANAVKAGGSEYREASDFGWAYYRAFQDLDGHIWEAITMDESKLPDEMKGEAS